MILNVIQWFQFWHNFGFKYIVGEACIVILFNYVCLYVAKSTMQILKLNIYSYYSIHWKRSNEKVCIGDIHQCTLETWNITHFLFVCTSLCVGNNKSLDIVSGVNNDDQLEEQQTAEITLSPTILDIIPEEEDVSIAVVVFDVTTLFPVREETTNEAPEAGEPVTMTVVGSQVVSIQVAGVVDGAPLPEPIQLAFRLNQLERMNQALVGDPVCVFWDFTLLGKWLTILQRQSLPPLHA